MKRRAARRSTLPFYLALSALVSTIALGGCSSCSRKSDGKRAPSPPLSIPAARAAYVTNNESDSITCLDRDGDATLHVKIDVAPDAHEAPHHLAIDAASGSVFVALAFPPEAGKKKKKDPHGGHGSAADVGKLVRLDLASLDVTRMEDVDENPGDVVLTHDKKRVLVTHFDMKRAMDVAARGGGSPATMFAQLVVFDAKTMKRVGARPVCTAPHGVVTTRDDTTAFVACYGSDELAVVDLSRDGFPTSRIPLGASQGVPGVPRYGPYSATLTPDERRVLVADLEGQDVRVFDRETKRFVESKLVPLAAKAFMPAFVDDHTAIVPLQSPDGLARVDIDAARVVTRVAFTKEQCTLPHVVRVAKDGRAYLVCEGDHRGPGAVLEIDKETLATKKRWAVEAYPDGIAFGDE